MSKNKIYWQGLDGLHNTPEHQEAAQNEFAPEATPTEFLGQEELAETGTKRRDFLKFMGFSLGAATLAACETPVNKAVPYLNKPEEIMPGVPNYYASTYFDGHDFCPVMVKAREGRPIFISGNKASDLAGGGVNARVNSSVLSLYDSERAKNPMKGAEESDWATVDGDIMAKLESIGAAGGAIRILSSTLVSPSTQRAIDEFTAKYGDVKVVYYDAVSYSGMLEANEASFGSKVMPDYAFDKADVVVGVNADFIGNFHNSIANAVAYGKRRVPSAKMSKHYQFETNLSITGSNADSRTPIKPSEVGAVLLGIHAELTGGSAPSTEYGDKIKAAAASLKAAAGKSILVCGSSNTADQMVANAINDALGNVGSTINIENGLMTKKGIDSEVNTLIDELKAGSVQAILINGCNPAYSHARADEFKAGLAKAELSVSFGINRDETAEACGYLCPDNHYLESWNDHMPKAGSYSLTQPVIQPLYNTRQFQESLLKWSGNDADFYTYMKTNWEENIHGGFMTEGATFSEFFNTALFNGYVASNSTTAVVEEVADEEAVAVDGESAAMDLSAAVAEINGRSGGTWELQLYEKAGIGIGNQANNPWLQELADPISRVTWDNYITMSLTDMKNFNEEGLSRLERGDYMANVVTVTANGKSVTLPVYPSPGQKQGTIGIAVGYGRTAAGKCGNGVGQNAFPLSANGLGVYSVEISAAAEEKYEIASVQTHTTLMGRDSILKETTLTEYLADPKAGNPDMEFYVASGEPGIRGFFKDDAEEDHGHGHDDHGHGHDDAHGEEGHGDDHGGESHGGHVATKKVNLWGDFGVETSGHRWGMTIDLNTCIGCGSCVTACHSENNVPVVGKEEVRRSRDMSWLRIDRYYSSDMTEEVAAAEGKGAVDMFTAMEEAADLPEVAFQPVMCQHCNHAPCETVCPVAATTHSEEGMNQMAYNRCIGTRYCGNNCPYKVRRFNWFQYHGGSKDFDTNPANDPMARMVLNPDVVVRDRGVMEKCSFCVQRIQAVKLKSKKAGHKVKDDEMQSACSEACPTNAIMFGDLNDTEGATKASKDDARSYNLLEEVGVQPNVYYKTLVRNV